MLRGVNIRLFLVSNVCKIYLRISLSREGYVVLNWYETSETPIKILRRSRNYKIVLCNQLECTILNLSIYFRLFAITFVKYILKGREPIAHCFQSSLSHYILQLYYKIILVSRDPLEIL